MEHRSLAEQVSLAKAIFTQRIANHYWDIHHGHTCLIWENVAVVCPRILGSYFELREDIKTSVATVLILFQQNDFQQCFRHDKCRISHMKSEG
jgi:hypothetical protein